MRANSPAPFFSVRPLIGINYFEFLTATPWAGQDPLSVKIIWQLNHFSFFAHLGPPDIRFDGIDITRRSRCDETEIVPGMQTPSIDAATQFPT